MKKLKIIALVIMLTMLFAVPAMAVTTKHDVAFVVGQKNFTVDGAIHTADAAPFIENNRTYVPVRFLANALGVPDDNIEWVRSTQTVTLVLPADKSDLELDERVELVIGSKIVWSQRLGYTDMDVAPVVKNGRTFLPARFVAEAFGYQVGWDGLTQKVLIGAVAKVDPPPKTGTWERNEVKAELGGLGQNTTKADETDWNLVPTWKGGKLYYDGKVFDTWEEMEEYRSKQGL